MHITVSHAAKISSALSVGLILCALLGTSCGDISSSDSTTSGEAPKATLTLAPTSTLDTALPTDSTYFLDPILEGSVRASIGNRSDPISDEELANVTNLRIFGGVKDLTGIDRLVSLVELELSQSQILDSSLLIALPRWAEAGDLSALNDLIVLSESKNLQNLVSDLSPLSSLSSLTSLSMEGSKITDLSPLASLSNLSYIAYSVHPQV